MLLSRDDRYFLFVMTAVIMALFWGLVCNIRKRVNSGAQFEAVGTVEYKRHVVMRKYGNRFVWENINPKTPVYLYDSILTRDQSDAVVTLKNGVRLELDPNTMVEIDLLEGKTGLNLKSGNINTESTSNSDAFIRTLTGDLLNVSNSKTRLSQTGDQLMVSVRDGKVTMGDKDIESGERVLFEKGNVTREKISLKAEKPEDGKVILTGDGSEVVRFAWPKTGGIETYEIMLGKTAALNWANSRSVETRSGNIDVNLSRGIWYWQLIGKKANGEKEISQVYVLRVLESEKIRLYSPAEGETTGTRVGFRWESPKVTSTSLVQFDLSQSQDFKNPLKSFTTQNSYIEMDELKPGRYYWRIVPAFGGKSPENRSGTAVGTFVVSKDVKSGTASTEKNTDIKSLLDEETRRKLAERKSAETFENGDNNKADQKTTDNNKTNENLITMTTDNQREKQQEDIRRGKETISWKKQSKADEYQVDVAKDKNLKSKILSEKTKKNYVVLPENLKENKKYYWQVEAKDKKGATTARSKVQDFEVKPAKKFAGPDDLTGREGDVKVREKTSLKFRWKKIPEANRYTFQLVDQKTKNPVLTRETQNTETTVEADEKMNKKPLEWRVKASLVEKGKVIRDGEYSKGKPFVLKVDKSLQPPEVLKISVKDRG